MSASTIPVDDVDDPADMPLRAVTLYRRRRLAFRADLAPFQTRGSRRHPTRT